MIDRYYRVTDGSNQVQLQNMNLNWSSLHDKTHPLQRDTLNVRMERKIIFTVQKWGSLMLSSLGKIISKHFEIFVSFSPGNRN